MPTTRCNRRHMVVSAGARLHGAYRRRLQGATAYTATLPMGVPLQGYSYMVGWVFHLLSSTFYRRAEQMRYVEQSTSP